MTVGNSSNGIGILTNRQAEVLRYTILGHTQREISKQLGISQPRVSAAIKTAKDKVRLARETLDFNDELKYLAILQESGYKGNAIMKKGYLY